MKKRISSYYQKRLRKVLFQMAAWSLAASLVWTLLGIYTAWHKEKGIEVDKDILKPISIKFDTETLKQLETRQALPPNFKLKEASGQN